jgi:Protein of unknown function (DUF4242)
MPTYLVERSLPGFTVDQLPLAAGAAKSTCESIAATGTPVRYLRSTFVPTEEKCYCLFDAESEDVVRQANEQAQLPFERIVLAEPITAEQV